MKKLFSLFALLTVFIGANADTKEIFKWHNAENSADYVAEVGSAECLGGDASNRINYKQLDYLTISLNGKKNNLGDGSAAGTYIKVTPTQALKEGDVISMTAFRNKGDESKKSTAWLKFDNGAETEIGKDPEFPDINGGGDPGTISIEVTKEMAGATSFSMSRGSTGTNLFITSLVVTTTEQAPTPTTVPVESVSILGVTGESLNSSYLTLEKGNTATLTARVYPSNATNQNVTWEVMQNDEVISFEDGVATALKAGQAAVVVTTEDGQKQAYVYIIVTEPAPAADPTTFEIQHDGNNVTITPSNDHKYSFAVIVGEIEEALGTTDNTELFDVLSNMFFNAVDGVQTFDVMEDYLEYVGLEELPDGTDMRILVAEVAKEDGEIVRKGDIFVHEMAYVAPAPQGYTATLYNGDDTPITLENFDPTVKPAEATAANALIYVAADLSDVEGIIPNVVYEEGANSINIRNRAKELNLTDAQPFYIPEFFFADKVTYTRTFNNTEWQSMVLPFTYKGADFEGKAEVASFTGATLYDAENDGIYDMAYLLYQSEMDKNNLLVYEPVLIKAKEVGEITITWEKEDNSNLVDVFSSDDVFNSPTSFKDQSGTKYTLSTTFQPMAMYQTGYYGLSNGEFKYALSENAVLPPFRAYLEIAPGDGPQVPVCGLLVDDDPTAIKQINASKADNNYYDLSGRKVINPTSGIYVKNGKKVLVK